MTPETMASIRNLPVDLVRRVEEFKKKVSSRKRCQFSFSNGSTGKNELTTDAVFHW